MTARARGQLVSPLLAAVLLGAAGAASSAAADEAGAAATRWSSALLRRAKRWAHAPGDDSIAVVEEGLRVAVPPGRAWRIAAADRIGLPPRVREIRLRVAEVAGTARWLLRVYGELRGGGRPRTVGLFQGETRTGEVARGEPRPLRRLRRRLPPPWRAGPRLDRDPGRPRGAARPCAGGGADHPPGANDPRRRRGDRPPLGESGAGRPSVSREEA